MKFKKIVSSICLTAMIFNTVPISAVTINPNKIESTQDQDSKVQDNTDNVLTEENLEDSKDKDIADENNGAPEKNTSTEEKEDKDKTDENNGVPEKDTSTEEKEDKDKTNENNGAPEKDISTEKNKKEEQTQIENQKENKKEEIKNNEQDGGSSRAIQDNKVILPGWDLIGSYFDAIELGFDSVTMKLKAISKTNRNFSSYNFEVNKITVYDKSGIKKSSISIHGSDKVDDVVNKLNDIGFEYGDYIKFYTRYEEQFKITGNVINGIENYSDGINSVDDFHRGSFKITQNGLEFVPISEKTVIEFIGRDMKEAFSLKFNHKTKQVEYPTVSGNYFNSSDTNSKFKVTYHKSSGNQSKTFEYGNNDSEVGNDFKSFVGNSFSDGDYLEFEYQSVPTQSNIIGLRIRGKSVNIDASSYDELKNEDFTDGIEDPKVLKKTRFYLNKDSKEEMKITRDRYLKNTISFPGWYRVSGSFIAIELGFDLLDMKFKVMHKSGSNFGDVHNEVNKITLYDKSGREKKSISMEGADNINDIVDELNRIDFEFGDTIKLKTSEYHAFKINGNVINGIENYSNGIHLRGDFTTGGFKITQDGLEFVRYKLKDEETLIEFIGRDGEYAFRLKFDHKTKQVQYPEADGYYFNSGDTNSKFKVTYYKASTKETKTFEYKGSAWGISQEFKNFVGNTFSDGDYIEFAVENSINTVYGLRIRGKSVGVDPSADQSLKNEDFSNGVQDTNNLVKTRFYLNKAGNKGIKINRFTIDMKVKDNIPALEQGSIGSDDASIKAYLKPFATANDPDRGDISSEIEIKSHNVNPEAVGNYKVTYSVPHLWGTDDKDGDVEVIRTISVTVPMAIPFQVITNLIDKNADPFIAGKLKLKNNKTSDVKVFVESFKKVANSGDLDIVAPNSVPDWDALPDNESMKKMALGMFVESGISGGTFQKGAPLWFDNNMTTKTSLGTLPRATSLTQPSEATLSFEAKHGKNFNANNAKALFELEFKFE